MPKIAAPVSFLTLFYIPFLSSSPHVMDLSSFESECRVQDIQQRLQRQPSEAVQL